MKNFNKNDLFLFCVLLFLIITPYLFDSLFLRANGMVFGGFLLNPIDGYSYLAKMKIGENGFWLFSLPYTASISEGKFIFLFYIFLGHIAKFFNLPGIWVFHIFRIIGFVSLFFTFKYFLSSQILVYETEYFSAMVITFLGSGMGWILLGSGYLPVNFYVAEAYPFLSCYTNPHFPIGLSLMLIILANYNQKIRYGKIATVSCSILLSIIMPFGIILVGAFLFCDILLRFIRKEVINYESFVLFIAGGVPLLFYQYLVVIFDPQLSAWNVQNVTPAPPLWDTLLSFSPAIFLAISLPLINKKCLLNHKVRLLYIWMVVALVLIYIPFNLQRRFLLGFYIPVAILSTIAITELARKKNWAKTVLVSLFFVLSLISNLLIAVLGISGALIKNPNIVISIDEMKVLNWISENTDKTDVILSSPEMGALIPAFSGRRVIYGHPFETINAHLEKQYVEDFFLGNWSEHEIMSTLTEKSVDYVIYGEREKLINPELDLSFLRLVFLTDSIQVYSLDYTN